VGAGDLSRIETSISPSFSVTSQSLLRTLAARDNILSAYPSFELSKFGKIVLTITFSQFFFSSSILSHLRGQLQGQLRVVGAVVSWCISVVCISPGHSPSIDVIHEVKALT